MGNIHENIKKDLLYLYNELYCLSQCESAGNFFDKKFLRSLKYKPEEVEEVLSSSVDILDKKKTGNNSEIISNIQTVEQVRKYFEDNLLVVCQPNISEEEKSSVLKKVTLEEIKHLYQIVFGISLADKCKKIDAVYRIRDFFENYTSIREKAIYIVGKYRPERKWTRKRISYEYNVPRNRIGIMPYTIELEYAIDAGRLQQYLCSNYMRATSRENEFFIRHCKKNAKLVENTAREIKKEMIRSIELQKIDDACKENR